MVVCEHRTANLSCTHHPDNKVIHLLSAVYGRQGCTLRCDYWTPEECNTTCAQDSLIEALAYCKEQYCEIWASNHIFGDPCPGAPKYLEITYQCIFKQGMYG